MLRNDGFNALGKRNRGQEISQRFFIILNSARETQWLKGTPAPAGIGHQPEKKKNLNRNYFRGSK